MPESDTWTGGVAMETMTSMDSAGSCDSVVSVNSVFSDDSLEHLSPEERACLMFLEETIESLEAEEDSGLSTDEPEDRLPMPNSLVAKMVQRTSSMGQSRMDDVSNNPYNHPMKDHKASSYLVPSPLVLANNGSSTLPKAGVGVGAGTDPLPATTPRLTDLPPDRVDLVHLPINVSPDIDPGQGNVLVIPPPTDFRDEPVEQEDLPGGSTPLLRRPLSQGDIMQLLRKSVSKDEAKLLTVTHDDQSHNGNSPPSPSETPPASPYDFDEPKNHPPAVAPKPKRLPSNIILKTSKGPIPSPVSSPDQSTSSSCTSPNDKILMDPQKVRMEALRKLGLLKDDEVDSGPTHSTPPYSPKLHRSWEHPPSLVTPASTDPPQIDIPKAQSSPNLPRAKEAREPKFHGEYRERSSSELPSVTRPSRTISTGEKSATLERMGSGLSYSSMGQISTSSGQDKGLPKSLEMDSLSQLRNTRPRPASLGNGKDFRTIQGDAPRTAAPGTAVAKPPEFGDGVRHLQASSSQKLPRSQGVSVLITPRSKSGEDRREALRKLGLLKD
ncbi:specifically androgen-regulated gene protein [Anguilla anguilla]|uniref:Specifically androgen-regulated gene protein n=1 Tax=Anguilla anguilla TaxID=7936 RepID=A0A9D3LXN4_ANGAN|nr:specifically androgen-regulated gene protein [Anguilla anguilla]KAG5838281.1 hypothetical protein ANANG_G00222110 [Anguilla anguilla]